MFKKHDAAESKYDEEFKKKVGMTPLEFTRFIRIRTAKKIDAKLRRQKRN